MSLRYLDGKQSSEHSSSSTGSNNDITPEEIVLKDEQLYYTGWRLYKNVTLIEEALSPNNALPKGYIPKVYIADASDKRQLETGRNWAKLRTYKKVADPKNPSKTINERLEIPGKEYTFENKGFKLRLSDSPSSSWQGGKLSFCMCIIEKDGHIWRTGISSDLLINLLKQTDCLKGEVQGEICFARNNGKVGMVAVGTTSYLNAINDDRIRKKVAKTKKAQIGYEHKALVENNVWLFDIYDWIEEESVYFWTQEPINSSYRNSNGYWSVVSKLVFKDKPTKKHIYVPYRSIQNLMSEVQDILSEQGGPYKEPFTISHILQGDIISMCYDGYTKKISTLKSFYREPLLIRSKVESFPSRAIGNLVVKNDIKPDTYDGFIQKLASILEKKTPRDKYAMENESLPDSLSGRNTFSSNTLALVLGTSYTSERPEIDMDRFNDWLKNYSGSLIIEIGGIEYKSGVLVEREKRGIMERKQRMTMVPEW